MILKFKVVVGVPLPLICHGLDCLDWDIRTEIFRLDSIASNPSLEICVWYTTALHICHYMTLFNYITL